MKYKNLLTNKYTMKRIVLDASAAISGIQLLPTAYTYLTSPSVIDEITSKRGKKNLQLAIGLNSIEQRFPKKEFFSGIEKAAEETNDNLSQQDKEIIALALEFKADIATDDYGIQNVAAKLWIKAIPVGERGIKKIIHWQHYCPGCKAKYSAAGVCGVCGTKLKRKAKK